MQKIIFVKGFHSLKEEGKTGGFPLNRFLFRRNILHGCAIVLYATDFRTFHIDEEFYFVEFRMLRINVNLYWAEYRLYAH